MFYFTVRQERVAIGVKYTSCLQAPSFPATRKEKNTERELNFEFDINCENLRLMGLKIGLLFLKSWSPTEKKKY